MLKIEKNEEILIKTFLNYKEPEFVRKLNLIYDMDYYYGLSSKILKNASNLNMNIENLDSKTQKKINDYINNEASEDDIIYYYLSEIIINIAKKYYNIDGTLKDVYK